MYIQDIVDPTFTIPVMAYPQWGQRLGTPEISPLSPNSFAIAFPIAAMGAIRIHFNVQGILNSEDVPVLTYDDYINRYGSQGRFTGRFVTADQLYWVKTVFCSKTDFYDTTDGITWVTNPAAKSQICAS